MELTAADRLKIHLTLHYPRLKMKHVRLSEHPGFLQAAPYGLIDIRGIGYAAGNPPFRLWNELHEHFTQHVEVIKSKNKTPTVIVWNGLVYHLDQAKSFKAPTVSRRNSPQRTRTAKVVKSDA